MKGKFFLLLFFIIYMLVPKISAQSFEGYISDTLPVWFEFNEPSKDGDVIGTYFYKTIGEAINISGKIKENNLTLNETDKNGKLTGIFNCNLKGDSIIGNWNRPNSNKFYSVRLYNVNNSFKEFAKIPNSEKLILNDGRTLKDEIKESEGENATTLSKLNYCFSERAILTTFYDWEFMGAYSSIGTVYHTFNLKNNQEILLINEFKQLELDRIKESLRQKIQEKLNMHRKEMTDSEWINIFGDKETYNNAFIARKVDDEVFKNFYLKYNHVYILIDSYLGLPHSMRAADISMEFHLGFPELKSVIKKESILNNL
jgi:hypothetical protein